MPNKLTKPSLEHLKRLTDDTGLLQHAKFIIPDRSNGYCTDDTARAVVVMTKYYKQYPEPEALRLFEIYLAFLYHALKPDKTVYNFMDYDRNWKQNKPAGDALGRSVWAFGSVISSPPDPAYVPVVREFFNDTSKHIPKMSPRGMAYSMLGLAECLRQFPNAKETKELKCAICGEQTGCSQCEFQDDCDRDLVSGLCICKKCFDSKDSFALYKDAVKKNYTLNIKQ